MAAKAKRTKARGDARADAELRLEGLEVEVEVLVPVEELVLLADAISSVSWVTFNWDGGTHSCCWSQWMWSS